MARRYPTGEGPKVFYTDSCCAERALLLKIFFPDFEIKSMYDGKADIVKFQGKVVATRNVQEIDEAVKSLSKSNILSIDCEWNPAFLRKNSLYSYSSVSYVIIGNEGEPFEDRVSVLTIGSPSLALVYLFREHEEMPNSLKQLLLDPSIIKIGYNVKGDVTRLSNSRNVNVAGVIDVMVQKCAIEVMVGLKLKKKRLNPLKYGMA